MNTLQKIWRLISRGPKKFEFGEIEYPRLPEGRVIFAIGDVHGRLDLLERIHIHIDKIRELQKSADITEIYLGDLIDRGPDSRGVLDCLLKRSKLYDIVVLKGNHEDALVNVIDGKLGSSIWMSEGGSTTLSSYGFQNAGATSEESSDPILGLLPDDHIEFLRHLPLYYEECGYIFVHAGLRPKVLLNRQVQRDMLWITDDFLNFRGKFDGVIIHGHSVVERPEFYRSRIAIDTGAWTTGRLTCLMLSSVEMRVLST